MNFGINPFTDFKFRNSFRTRPSNGSYRIFHITKKSPDESDEEQTVRLKSLQNTEIKLKPQKKSFKLSNRNGLDGWKRRSTKKKSFRSQKTSSSSYFVTNDSSPSINSKRNLHKQTTNLSDSEILGESIQQNDATLDDLLARATQLENTVVEKEFRQIQPSLSRANSHRRRKRFLIACCTLSILLIIIIILVIFIVIQILRYEKHSYDRTTFVPSTSIYDV